MTLLIDELEALKAEKNPSGLWPLWNQSTLDKVISVVRKRQQATEEKIIAAMNAEPIEVPKDKKGYFGWLKAPLKPNSEKNADDLTIEQIERIIANHESGVQIASVHLYRQLLAAMRGVSILSETNERNVESAWKCMEDMKAECERLRAYIENWILVLDPEPGTTVNIGLMQDEARKVLVGSGDA